MSIVIKCHPYLPSATVWVSADVYELLKAQLGEEELDRRFLHMLGIGEELTNAQPEKDLTVAE
jgi:hypothetical protein